MKLPRMTGIAWTKTWFNGNSGDFAACHTAEWFLESWGFCVGHAQRGAPRGILFGDYDIQKWRNLNQAHREALHGTMTGDMRNGPVIVTIFETAPAAAKDALAEALSVKTAEPTR